MARTTRRLLPALLEVLEFRSNNEAVRARELLALVGLSHRFGHRPNQLSGGEQQRVAIARALATNPALVIADEPTGNLDGKNGAKVLDLIRDLQTQTETTFIIATHDPGVAAAAAHVIMVADGQIVSETFPGQGENATQGERSV